MSEQLPWLWLVGWYVLLLCGVIAMPYRLGLRLNGRDWRHITVAVTFLTWLLLGIATAR